MWKIPKYQYDYVKVHITSTFFVRMLVFPQAIHHIMIEVIQGGVSWIDTLSIHQNSSIQMAKFDKTDVTGCHHTIYGKNK